MPEAVFLSWFSWEPCVPSFTSMCYVGLRSEVVIGKSARGHFFVDDRHGNTKIHMRTKFYLHALYGVQV